jgi:hypothetical protein
MKPGDVTLTEGEVTRIVEKVNTLMPMMLPRLSVVEQKLIF